MRIYIYIYTYIYTYEAPCGAPIVGIFDVEKVLSPAREYMF